MSEKFGEDLLTTALPHGLLNEIAFARGKQAVASEDLDVRRLGMKCCWCWTTMLMSQLLSENVVSEPMPDLLRVDAVSKLKSSRD